MIIVAPIDAVFSLVEFPRCNVSRRRATRARPLSQPGSDAPPKNSVYSQPVSLCGNRGAKSIGLLLMARLDDFLDRFEPVWLAAVVKRESLFVGLFFIGRRELRGLLD
jgi:hypothetical protein